jgi:hypothetical protein
MCNNCESNGTNLKSLIERKKICSECKFKLNDICSIDKEFIKEKSFTGRCPKNKFPKIKKKIKAPKIFKQINSFFISMKKWVKSGFSNVSKKEFDNRLSICKECEWFDEKALAGTGRCLNCGCSIQAKLRLKTEKCPINKW